MVKIYGIIHPITLELRYVGKTKRSLEERLKGHIKDSGRNSYSITNWIKGLIKKKLLPQIVELEVVQDDWVEAECFWISYAKYLGCTLLNHTAGGDGSVGFIMTEQTKEKLRQANLGKSPSLETREKLRIMGKSRPKESLAFYRYGLGKPRTEETKAKISKSHMGIVATEEVRDKIRNTLTGYKHTDEAKANMREAQLGRVFSEESIAKMRVAASKREAIKRLNRQTEVSA